MSKWWIVFLLIIAALTAVFIFGDQVTAVNPAWPEAREGDSIPPLPQAGDSPFHKEPFADTYEARRQAYLAWTAELEMPETRGGMYINMAQMAIDPDVMVADAPLQDALNHVNQRNDTADFATSGLIRLYYGFPDRLTPAQKAAIEDALINFKYWLDEPNPSEMELWTENHQILVHTAEYLAGQAFPEAIFSNDGRTGAEHMASARDKILRWIDLHARTGMAEWDSNVYYPMDLIALLNLVDYADPQGRSEEEELSTKAAMMVDLLLMDMGADMFYGQYGTSHGRSKADSIKSAAQESTISIAALVWGLGRFQGANRGSIALATSEKYDLPPLIEAVGQDNPERYANYERHSIPITEEAAAEFGLSLTDINDAPLWWGIGAFSHPNVVNLTVDTADDWDLWHYRDFRDMKDVGRLLQNLGILSQAVGFLNPDANGVVMSEVNKLTYRTPDYMLANAQDYRPGEKGYQQHIWQATMGPYAVVFATNPDALEETDNRRPSYWASHGRLPRTAQYDNVLIALHKINRHPSPSIFEARHYAFTHAYFPAWAFDEVVERDGWIFGRLGDGYIALFSDMAYEWQTEGPDAGQEVIALGHENVWIVQMGRAATDGSFEMFMESISNAPLLVDDLTVEFESPGNGLITFGWEDTFTVNGQAISLRDYPRFDNPYTRSAEFGTGLYRFEHDGQTLVLDFQNAMRQVNGE
jgi:hypothetical protein